MDIKKNKTRGFFALSVLIILCLSVASIMSFYSPKDNANAFIANNIPSQSTNLGEMLLEGYEEDTTGKGNVFDKEIFWELVSQVTGVENPNANTLNNLDLTTETTSNDFRTFNDGMDVVVIIDGIPWTATYLSANEKGEPILTLWQTDIIRFDYYNPITNTMRNNNTVASYSTSNNYTDAVSKYPSSSYGTSYVSTAVLNNGGAWARTGSTTEQVAQNEKNTYAKFTMDSVKGSLTQFIDVPNDVPFQNDANKESAKTHSFHFAFDANNDVLGAPIASNMYTADLTYYTNAAVDKTGYLAWGDDKIWLPSLAEVGHSTNGGDTSGLWKTSINQRAMTASIANYQWLRSALHNMYIGSYVLSAGGDSALGSIYVNLECAIRPAFHLNLKKAAERAGVLGLVEPTDISIGYTGENLTIANAPDEQKSWYNSDKIDLEYPTSGMVDAGTYQVTAKIKESLAADGLEFNGEPGDGETTTTRIFNFTITKKKIGIEEISEVEGGLSATVKAGAVYGGDTAENGRAPTFGFTYTSTDGKGYNSDTYPTAIGAYKATVKITNECNYELDKEYTHTFTIDKKEVAKPSIGVTELEYNGLEREFIISGVSNDVTITADGGMTYSDGKLKAKNVKEYTVTIALADHGVSTQWVGGGSEPITVKIKITKAQLDITFVSDGGWSWNSNTEKTVSITDNRLNDNDVLNFSFSYDSTQIDARNVSYEGKRTDVKIPPLATKDGAYVLKVTLDSSGEGGNYTLTSNNTQEFRITDKEIAVEKSNITWQYSNFKVENGNAQKIENSGSVFELMYNGEEYRISVLLDSYLQENGVTVSGYEIEKGKEVGSYTTKVNLTSTQGKLTQSSFELQWRINKGKYDLSNVNWNYTDGMYKYGNRYYTVELQNLPSGLSVDATTGYEDNSQKAVGSYTARVLEFVNGDNNYITPDLNDDSTYIGTFPKTLEWRIDKGTLTLEWGEEVKTDGNGATFKYKSVKGENADKIEGYKYYRYVSGQKGEEVTLDSIEVGEGIERYLVEAVLKESASKNYDATPISQIFVVGSNGEEVYIDLTSEKYTYDGKAHGNELKIVNDVDFTISRVTVKYYKESVSEENILEGAPTDAGRYVITLELSAEDEGYYYLRKSVIEYEIEKKKIVAQWDTSGKSPILSEISKEDKEAIEYEYYDGEGNLVEESQLEAGKTYTVKAKIKDEYRSNYEFVGVDGSTLNEGVETDGEEFEMKDYDPNDPNDPNHPDNPNNPNNPDGDNDNDGNGSVDFEKVGEILKQWWQVVASGISIILIIIFLAKTIGYERRRKEAKKENDERYKTFYAVSGTGLFGLAMTGWTALACILMVSAVASFAIMEVAKNRCSKAEKELSYSKEEYNRMMYMRMMGGNAGNMQNGMGAQGFAYAPQQGLGAEEIRGIVSETMTALLPGMQQMLPQQASANDELVQKLIEQNEKLMQKLSEQQPVERVIEKEVSSSNINDERILKVVAQSENNDETIKRMLKTQEDLMRNQDRLMEKILELSTNKPVETQVVEKEVRVEVPVEKVVEKEVVKEVKVEVPVEVEKIVEKEVPIEVEKVVEKIVEIPAEKPASTAKKPATPRLTLDEAYAKLSKQQKKFFDTLKEYAMSKDKCKEKKSTYYILLGQSSVNPLVKLTIKKDCTVALFKMEDEYMKDIRRNAGSEGTKVKVKETELIVGDSQALATAKEMIDLREDQIERYNDYLKEQRSMKKR